MTNWTKDYLLHTLEAKDWSMNRLASEIGVSSSTVNRPIRSGEPLSAKTITKIFRATGIDPAPFIPSDLKEPPAVYTAAPRTPALTRPPPSESKAAAGYHKLNEINITFEGDTALIVARVNRHGVEKLQKKLALIDKLLSE